MFDKSHKKSRGYGTILEAAQPGEDGERKWKVDFEGGQRNTAIAEKYLEVPHIDHRQRQAPTGYNQRIVVMVGTCKGQEGATVSKVGRGLQVQWGRRQAGCLACAADCRGTLSSSCSMLRTGTPP